MSQIQIRTRCLRCGIPFLLPIGLNLTDWCETCRKQVGRRMDVDRQHKMNSNWAWQRDRLRIDPASPRAPIGPFMEPNGTRPFIFVGKRHK